MGKLFSKRQNPAPELFNYELSDKVRSRIIHTIGQMCARPDYGAAYGTVQGDMGALLTDVRNRCYREYGMLNANKNYRPPADPPEEALHHYHAATAEEVIDFLEMLFQSREYKLAQDGVNEVNAILREEGVGFEFSPYTTREVDVPPEEAGWPPGGRAYRVEVEYPEAIRKTSQQMHAEVIMPALTLLSGPKWKTANHEILEAHKALRENRLDDANTACGRAFETVFKTICTEKNWAYDKDKDTLSTLVDICRGKGLFPPFYVEILKSSGTVRNKLGGHGKGPTPTYQNDLAYAEHLIQQTSAHILLLAKLAGMN